MKIYIDVDGPLADFESDYLRHFGLRDPLPKMLYWEHLLHVTNSTFEDILQVQSMDGFLLGLREHYHARDLIEACSRYDKTPRFLTAVSHPDRVKWLKQRWPNSKVICTSDKEEIARDGALLIDDYEENVSSFRAHGGEAILFPSSSNRLSFSSSSPVAYVRQELERICNGTPAPAANLPSIALCGKPKSGKTTVAEELCKLGYRIVDDGAVLRECVATAYSAFGIEPRDPWTQEGKARELEVTGEAWEIRKLLGRLGNHFEDLHGDSFLALCALQASQRHPGPCVFPSVRKRQAIAYREAGIPVVEIDRDVPESGNAFDLYDKSLVDHTIDNNGPILETVRQLKSFASAWTLPKRRAS